LVQLLRTSEFDIQKESAWAIANATSGGDERQIRYLVSQDVIPPLCSLLRCTDSKVLLVSLEALENILKVGKKDVAKFNSNPIVEKIEECSGLDDLEALQKHENHEIYERSLKILSGYFETEGGEQSDATLEPEVNMSSNQFSFGSSTFDQGRQFSF